MFPFALRQIIKRKHFKKESKQKTYIVIVAISDRENVIEPLHLKLVVDL